MNQIGVLQVCDSLAAGGMERVAVNLANALPQDGYRSHVCATRVEGPMADFVLPHVSRICLRRTGLVDLAAVRKLIAYIRENDIQILHAHGTSLFLSVLVSMIKPRPLVIWHDHFGRYATEERPAWIYGLAAKRVDAVVTVNHALATWARKRLHVRADRVRYIPNFVCEPADGEKPPALPGKSGFRIVCVANFRPQKDHMNLLGAMRSVLRRMPDAHLLLLGHGMESACFQQVESEIGNNGLKGHVSVLGPRKDVNAVLRGCDLGVLSSSSEGLPLALLEYGMASLPVVATQVGQCEEVLSGGRCGMLVAPRDSEQLATAILALLESKAKRQELGKKLNARVLRAYSSQKVIEQITEVYETVLADNSRVLSRCAIMNQAGTELGMDALMADGVARREVRSVVRHHAARMREMSWIAVVLFIFLHMPLALLMKSVPTLGTIHALLALAVGIKWAWSGRELVKVAYAGAYITGSEIIWRAVGTSVFWEYGKYALVLLFVVALFRSHRLRFPLLPTLYFLLLIPATLVTIFQVSQSEARNMISFNLSGPLALAVSVVFFMGLKVSRRQFLRLLIAFIAPIVGVVAIILLGFATTTVKFGHESSAAASGGFGANQVSALLGMGCVAAFLCVLDSKLRWELKVLFFGLVVEFAMQSALTFSRAGVYYAGASIVAGCLMLMKQLRTALQLSVILGVLFLLANYVVYPRLDEFTGGALSERFQDTRLTGRTEIMDADLKIMAEHPVLGVGVGQAMRERARFFRGFAAHTEFTRLLSEHGSFGCVAVVLLVAMGIRNVRFAPTNRGRAIAASLVTYSFCFMTGNGMRMVLPSFVFGLAAVALVTDSRRPAQANGSRPRRSARPISDTRSPDATPHEPSRQPTRS